LQSRPEFQGCVVCCIHCGIRFFTHPRNAGRRNLRCPFGCREHHRRQRSSQRSAAYYRTPSGKRQKKLLNGRRSGHTASTAGRDAGYAEARDLDRPAAPADERRTVALPVTVELRLQGAVLDESDLATSPMLPYVRMVMGLIEGVELTCREVVGLLRQAMRQHSIGSRRRIDYLLGFLHQHPP
jgi:hypothetical protein